MNTRQPLSLPNDRLRRSRAATVSAHVPTVNAPPAGLLRYPSRPTEADPDLTA